MIRVLIATADQALAQELQRTVLEVPDTEVSFVATTTGELNGAALKLDVDVALVHEDLGPEPALAVIRDLGVRRPGTAMLLMTKSTDSERMAEAMEAGARGLVILPVTYSQLEGRILSAGDWAAQVRRVFAANGSGPATGLGGRGRVIGIAGSKGGVGTTTIATHFAFDVARTVTSLRVCLVDLDLEKGDVPGHVEVRHRLGIADLARVADDLSAGTIADAMTPHESGVDMLLAPLEIRDVEVVTPQALRSMLAALRAQYDLVLVDLGSHVTPSQAAAVELADEIVLTVTPDVASMRGMRRILNAWDSLAVCHETDVRVLVNRVSKQVTVSMDTVRQLTKASVIPHGIPSNFRRMEPALNARNPVAVRGSEWWKTLRAVGREINLVGEAAPRRPAPASVPAPEAAAAEPTSVRKRRRGRDRGAITLDFVGSLPLLLLALAMAWHIAMIGAAALLQSHAAHVASRAASIGTNPQVAVNNAMPPFADVRASSRGNRVSVIVDVPLIAGGIPGIPTQLRTSRAVVLEP